MSFIQREIDKIDTFLTREEYGSEAYERYYAAKQALCWALDPNAVASPYAMLSGERAHNPVNIQMVELPAA